MDFSSFARGGPGFSIPFLSFFKARGLVCLLALAALPAGAVRVHFPDEELASETVLPLIDPPKMVLNKNVPLKFRAELGFIMGFGLDEPFYFPFYPTGALVFNLTEMYAISLTASYFPPYRSSAGKTLSRGEGLDPGERFDPIKAPHPQMSLFINGQYSPFYGKISLSKNWVMNLSIYAFAGPGLIVSNHNDQWPAGNFGIGQKLYFNKWMGIRGDLGFYGYYGPKTARLDLGESVSAVRYQQLRPEEKRLTINVIANAGVVLLL